MPDAYPAASILCRPALSTCTWTWHKRHFARNCSGNLPDATDTTSIEHRALTPTVRTPSVWPHCLGKKVSWHSKDISQKQVYTEKCRTPVDMHMNMSQEACWAEIYRENAGRVSRGNHFVLHGYVIRGMLGGNLKGKCRTRIPGQAFCVSLRSRNAHGHVTRGILWKKTGKMSDATDTTSIEHRAWTLTVRILHCGHTLRGKIQIQYTQENLPDHAGQSNLCSKTCFVLTTKYVVWGGQK